MKSKLKFIVPIVLVLLGATYQFAFAKGAPAPKHKVDGEVYVLPKDFYVNLADGKFARLGVALVLEAGATAAPAAGGEHGAAEPPEGYGTLPQEPLVRSIVTDVLTDVSARRVASAEGRERLTAKILKRIRSRTDVPAEHVLLTDVAVQ